MSKFAIALAVLALVACVHVSTCDICGDVTPNRNQISVCQVVRVRPPPPPQLPTNKVRRAKATKEPAPKKEPGYVLSECTGARCLFVNILSKEDTLSSEPKYLDEVTKTVTPGVLQILKEASHVDISNRQTTGKEDKPRKGVYRFPVNAVVGPKVDNSGLTDITASMTESMTQSGQYRGVLIAHGGTGSGKTHTLGLNGKSGLIHQIADSLFPENNEVYKVAIFQVRASSVQDLQKFDELVAGIVIPKEVPVVDNRREVFDNSIMKKDATNSKEMVDMILEAAKHRSTGATKFNKTSSRKHMIIEIVKSGGSSFDDSSVLTIIDLAGNEDTTKTGDDSGKEINMDLVNLKLCMKGAVSEMSALCKMLQWYKKKPSPSGKESLLDIRALLTVNPLESDRLHTTETLKFGFQLAESSPKPPEAVVRMMSEAELKEKEDAGVEWFEHAAEGTSDDIPDDVVSSSGSSVVSEPAGSREDNGSAETDAVGVVSEAPVTRDDSSVVSEPAVSDESMMVSEHTSADVGNVALEQCRKDLARNAANHEETVRALKYNIEQCKSSTSQRASVGTQSVEVVCDMLKAAQSHEAMGDLQLPAACTE